LVVHETNGKGLETFPMISNFTQAYELICPELGIAGGVKKEEPLTLALSEQRMSSHAEDGFVGCCRHPSSCSAGASRTLVCVLEITPGIRCGLACGGGVSTCSKYLPASSMRLARLHDRRRMIERMRLDNMIIDTAAFEGLP
jgi:hypothetical protein